ncbi:MAG TPA: tail fiber protein [Actinomycetota bacterium]|nr:tail fiber protein [Actinomycetota bacterium]
MAEPFLGEVRLMAFTYPPRGWASCNGEHLPIAQNQTLSGLLGTTFGGDGQTTFALPNFQGRVPIHAGRGRRLGEAGGSETVALTEEQMPHHFHTMYASTARAVATRPPNAVLGAVAGAYGSPYSYRGNVALHPASVSDAGGGKPHDNMQPYLALTFCIALEGIFPRED